MRFLFPLILLATPIHALAADIRQSVPASSRQLVLVTTSGWTASRGSLQWFERERPGGAWKAAGRPVPALVGEKGMAWGVGLHAVPEGDVPRKREGDRRAPAGVFRIDSTFGRKTATALGGLQMPYLRIEVDLEAVDDPNSRFYNRIVRRSGVRTPDWRSSEKMAEIPDYELGLTVAHNPRCVPGAGSCIFIHLLIGSRSGTAGCTVLAKAALWELMGWLDPRREPVLVQVPYPAFRP